MAGGVAILDTTLREGEQFATSFFRREDRLALAKQLDSFGVDYIEVSSPVVSESAGEDIRQLRALGLKAKIMAHCRCAEVDVVAALECGAQGINLYQGSSPQLREFSHGRSLAQIAENAVGIVRMLRERGVFVRFSGEDAFRTDTVDLAALFDPIVEAGVQRLGLPDTTGAATPMQVFRRLEYFRDRYHMSMEFHGHNDTGCAIANALAAFEGGADVIDTTVLGIGERNGITSLSGLIARLYSVDKELVAGYKLDELTKLDNMVAQLVGVDIPFNAPITGPTSFTHKAGVHTNAVLRQPQTYEVLDPSDFGLQRRIEVASRITGKAAIRHRADQLGLQLDDAALREATRRIKGLAEQRPISTADVDATLAACQTAVAG